MYGEMSSRHVSKEFLASHKTRGFCDSTNFRYPEPLCVFFFFLGPVCISSGSTSAFKAYCAYPKFLTAQIHNPCGSYKETEVPK
jgi:hypothetical protein